MKIFNLDPGMRAPSFRCTTEPDGSLILHYYSERPGLEHIVIGIVKVMFCLPRSNAIRTKLFVIYTIKTFQAVASKLHDVEVDIKVIKRKGDPINLSQTIDVDNNGNKSDPEKPNNDKKNCTTKSYDTNNIKVPSSDSCE